MTDILAWHSFWAWLQRHDVSFDLAVVWLLFVGSFAMGTGKVFSWLTLRGSEDQGAVGRSLKKEKFSEAFAWYGLSALYGMTLGGYYFAYQYGFPERTALRIVLILAIASSLFYMSRFVYFLRKEYGRKTLPYALYAAALVLLAVLAFVLYIRL